MTDDEQVDGERVDDELAGAADDEWGTVDTDFLAIHVAARVRDLDAVRAEVEASVDVDALNGRAANGDGGNTALWFAAQGDPDGGAPIATYLIGAGAVVDRPCEHGWTALHMAAYWGHLDTVQVLLDHGADPSIGDGEGRTALDLARGTGRTAIVDLLDGRSS